MIDIDVLFIAWGRILKDNGVFKTGLVNDCASHDIVAESGGKFVSEVVDLDLGRKRTVVSSFPIRAWTVFGRLEFSIHGK